MLVTIKFEADIPAVTGSIMGAESVCDQCEVSLGSRSDHLKFMDSLIYVDDGVQYY